MSKPKIFYLWFVICLLLFGSNFSYTQGEVMKMKKIVMVVAQDQFRDEELLEPKEIFEKAGIEVKIASSKLGPIKGMLGAKVNAEFLINDINVRDFDAIVLVGGSGAIQYWDDPLAHALVQNANNARRIVAAICIAPVTLAKAGLLKGKRATVWPSESNQLKAAGANYTPGPVEKDGNIITASGPTAARQFAEEILQGIK